MKVGIVGIGLIGGSIMKRLCSRGFDTFVYDNDDLLLARILIEHDVNVIINYDDLDVLLIALPPNATISFIHDNASVLQNVLITDVCGVKECVSKVCADECLKYFGMHPMAGRETGGYINSIEGLFDGANLVVTDEIIPTEINLIISALGFCSIVVSSPAKHDKIIAYTSQLCHIASNAFAKSDTILHSEGFTGGSFEDITRVGRLDTNLWIQLFDKNRANLLSELNTYIDNLNEYKIAIEQHDDEKLISLCKDGINCINKSRK